MLRLAGIPSSYALVTDERTLDAALGSRFDQAIKKHASTMIFFHWSGHGNTDGVELSDGTFLDWPEFSDLLVNANRGDLGVCMSTCYGYEAHLTAREVLVRH